MQTIVQQIKQALVIIAIFAGSHQVIAQAPQKMSYQTVVRNSSNALVTSQGVGIQISILQGSASGSAVYVEQHFPNTNANGLATLEIGMGNVISGTFASIDWSNGPYFTKTEIDPNGGSNYTITGTSELMSVPYALHAKTADAIVGGGSSNWNTSGNNISNSNSGNVGIGTSTPSSKLEVKGGSNALVKLESTSTETDIHFNSTSGLWQVGSNNAGNGSNDNQFFIYDGAYRFTVQNGSGNVGIGTTSPDYTFSVHDGDEITANIQSSNTIGSQLMLKATNSGGQEWRLVSTANGASGDAGALGFFNSLSGYKFLLKDNGNLGLSTVSPNYRLHVNGSAGKPGGGSWTNASDKRLKNQISPYKDGLSTLLTINPVTYHYNEKSGFDTSIKYVGVVAQELKEIAPYMVGSFEQDGTDYLDVNNSAMTYMLINSVKEQQAQIEALKAKNEKMETENAALKASLQKIEAHLGLEIQGKK